MYQELIFFILISILCVLYHKVKTERNRNFIILILLLQGLTVLLLGSYVPFYLGLIPLFFVLYFFRKNPPFKKESISLIFNYSKIVNLDLVLPFLGLIIAILVFTYNYLSSDNALGGNDAITLTLAILLFLYPFLNRKYPFEYSFILSMLSLTFFFLVLPRLFFSQFGLENLSNTRYDDNIVFFMLNVPLSNILNFIGYSTFTESTIFRFYDSNDQIITVDIKKSCSGINTMVLFVSAFFSYILVTVQKFNLDTLLILFLGILASYFANLIRIIIIILVGMYYGLEEMLYVHENIGWVIFTLWIYIFWIIFMPYLEYEKQE